MTNSPAGPPSPPMKARRPYLLRAIHEWITDSLCTPHIVVDIIKYQFDVAPIEGRPGESRGNGGNA